MHNESNDQNLATQLGSKLDPEVPSNWRSWRETNLAELGTGASHGDAYVELQFHDNQSTQSWLYNQTHLAAWRYGYGVDSHLGYP